MKWCCDSYGQLFIRNESRDIMLMLVSLILSVNTYELNNSPKAASRADTHHHKKIIPEQL